MTETTEVLKAGVAPAGRHFCGAKAAVVTRNTRRIRLYLASNWPNAALFAQAMRALRSP